jgi:hypothetical protein
VERTAANAKKKEKRGQPLSQTLGKYHRAR